MWGVEIIKWLSKVIYDNKNWVELINHALFNYNIILPQKNTNSIILRGIFEGE